MGDAVLSFSALLVAHVAFLAFVIVNGVPWTVMNFALWTVVCVGLTVYGAGGKP